MNTLIKCLAGTILLTVPFLEVEANGSQILLSQSLGQLEPQATPGEKVVHYRACIENMQRLLSEINAVRQKGAQCGNSKMPPVMPLIINKSLEHAAFVHAYNMATYNFLSHNGQDGSDVGQRVRSYGYQWQFVGENIAAGQPSVDKAVEEWLKSPGHCKNLMSQEFKETGAACVANPEAEYNYYWVQVFAAPFE